ncbi:MAG: 50S ribosomal protein L24 [Bacteroidia bacterium]
MKLHIRKGDRVRVLSGKDRGEEGEVMVVYPKKQRAIVGGINIIRKAIRPDQNNPDGGIVEQEATIHISNLMLVEGGKTTRTGRQKNEKGKGLVRVSKNTGKIV